MARKVVGVGSVGTRCWIVLMLGRDEKDPLFLQIKEAQQSVLSPYLGASEYANQGERVVAGQRLMQAASDIFLGWQRTDRAGRAVPGLLRPPAAGLEVLVPHRGDGPRGLADVRRRCAGARWPGRTPGPGTGSPSPPTSAAPMSSTSAIADFASAYADQNERDYNALAEAAASGRVTAERGV